MTFGSPISGHVQCRSRDVAILDRRRQIRFVDQLAARRIDDAHALLHSRDGSGIDHVARLRAHSRVQRNKIAFGKKLIERHEFHGQFPRCRFADERIISDDAHIESFRPRRHFAPDAAKTHQPQSLSTHFGAGRRFFPPTFAHRRVKFWKLPNQRQQQRKGVLRNADRAPARCAHHQNAALRGFIQIDIVHANTRAAHYPQFFRTLQQFRSDFRRAAHNQRIRIANLRIQRIFRRQYHVPSGLLFQQFHAAVADFVRYDDFHAPRRLLRVLPAQNK